MAAVLQLRLNGGFKRRRGHNRRSLTSRGGMAESRHVPKWLIFIGRNHFPSRIIFPDVKSSVHDPDERNDLAAIVFDKKEIFIANCEGRTVADRHCFAIDRPTKCSHRIGFPRRTFERVFHLESDVTDDVTLAALADPFRSDFRYRPPKYHLSLIDQL